jgi:glucose/arabinose dehydrogenase
MIHVSRSLRPAAAAILLLPVLVIACLPAPSSAPTVRPSAIEIDAAAIDLRTEVVVGGLEAPLLVTNAGDGSGRLFVVEQAGRVRVVQDGRLVDAPFLDVAGRISSGGERGFLGLAFHPDFPGDPRIFVDYTDPDGNTVVSAFNVSGGQGSPADTADPSSERVLLRVSQPFANHNGGGLAFGPDGYLYIGTGDGGDGGDPQENGQRLDTLLGKLLRIDVDAASGGRPYAIPSGNPFLAGGGAPEIWAYGLRNPWRFSFDRVTGDLWIGDVGQNSYEEIDRTRAGAPSPANYGWNRMEAMHCFEPASECDETDLVAPIAEYDHDAGCAVTGGHVARGERAGALAGVYVFGDYCSGRIWGLDANGPDRQEPVLLLESGRSISSFGEDEAGAILLTDSARGELVRLVAGG